MADITITPANVLAPLTTKDDIAGEALAIGDVVCKKDTTVNGKAAKRFYGAQCDVLADSIVDGIVIGGALAAEQPIRVVRDRGVEISIGGTTVVGVEYVLSANKGKISPRADLVTGNFYRRIGIGIAGNKIRLDINNTGLTIP
jgi:hypothetical protein